MEYEGTAQARRGGFSTQHSQNWVRAAVLLAPNGFDPASDGVCALRDGRIVCANQTALTLLEAQSLIDVVGRPFACFVVPESRGRVENGLSADVSARCDRVHLLGVSGREPGGIVNLVATAAEDRALRLVFMRRTECRVTAEKEIVQMSGEAGQQVAEGVTVLICDDEARLAALTAGLLEDYGFRPITAEQGDRALRLIEGDASVRVLLLDVNLSTGLSTRDLLDRLHARSASPRVILTSGLAVEDVPEELIQHSCVAGYLAKPYSVEQLVEAIRSATTS